MKSTKALMVFSLAACLFSLGVVLWVYFFPERLPPFLIAAANFLGIFCMVLACFKEGSSRFGLRKSTPPLMKALAAVSACFAFFGMFLNLGTVRPDIFRDADGIYYYKGPEPRVEASAEDIWRLERAWNRTGAGMGLMFTAFPAAYFSGVQTEEQE